MKILSLIFQLIQPAISATNENNKNHNCEGRNAQFFNNDDPSKPHSIILEKNCGHCCCNDELNHVSKKLKKLQVWQKHFFLTVLFNLRRDKSTFISKFAAANFEKYFIFLIVSCFWKHVKRKNRKPAILTRPFYHFFSAWLRHQEIGNVEDTQNYGKPWLHSRIFKW